jgi:glycine betaine/proline transport system substrate-binding protein
MVLMALVVGMVLLLAGCSLTTSSLLATTTPRPSPTPQSTIYPLPFEPAPTPRSTIYPLPFMPVAARQPTPSPTVTPTIVKAGAAISATAVLSQTHPFTSTAGAGTSEDVPLPGAGKTVLMGRPTWDTGWFQVEVVTLLLEELGYTVEGPFTLDNPTFYSAVARGDVHLWVNGWFPLHSRFVNQNNQRNTIVLVGHIVSGGSIQGYLIDKQTADTHQITNLRDFLDPEVAKLFDHDGNQKADLIGCDVGWGCEEVINYHLDSYGLHATVEHVQGDYITLMSETISRYNTGQSILFYTWTPNWTVSKLVPGEDVIWLEVPYPDLPADQVDQLGLTRVDDVIGCGEQPCLLGWPSSDIRAVAYRPFLEENPAVFQLLKSLSIPLIDVADQNARMFEGENKHEDIRGYAHAWIERNRAQVAEWLTEAQEAGLSPTANPDSERLQPE